MGKIRWLLQVPATWHSKAMLSSSTCVCFPRRGRADPPNRLTNMTPKPENVFYLLGPTWVVETRRYDLFHYVILFLYEKHSIQKVTEYLHVRPFDTGVKLKCLEKPIVRNLISAIEIDLDIKK